MRVTAPAAPLITMSNGSSAGCNQGGWRMGVPVVFPRFSQDPISISNSVFYLGVFFVFPQLECSLWKLSVRLRGSIMHTNKDVWAFRHKNYVCRIQNTSRHRHSHVHTMQQWKQEEMGVLKCRNICSMALHPWQYSQQGHLMRHSQWPHPAILPLYPMFNQENCVGHCPLQGSR